MQEKPRTYLSLESQNKTNVLLYILLVAEHRNSDFSKIEIYIEIKIIFKKINDNFAFDIDIDTDMISRFDKVESWKDLWGQKVDKLFRCIL